MKKQILKCVEAIRSAYGDELEIHLPVKQDTEECVFFQLNEHARVNVFIECDAYHVYVTAFYGQSRSDVALQSEDIPIVIQRLYIELIGPNSEGKLETHADCESDCTVDHLQGWDGLIGRMKSERLKNQGDRS